MESLTRVRLFAATPGSPDHGNSQAKILEWVAISFFRESSRPRDRTHVSCMGRRLLYLEATREALIKRELGYLVVTRKHGGAWWAAIYGVAQSRTRLKQLSSSSRKHQQQPTQSFMVISASQSNYTGNRERQRHASVLVCVSMCPAEPSTREHPAPSAWRCSWSQGKATVVLHGRTPVP